MPVADTVAVAERTLPFNLDAERSVLGAIIVDNKAFDLAVNEIDDGSFFRDAHRRLFLRMADLRARGDAIDFVTLKEELQKHGDLDEVGGPAYVAGLADGVPRATNVVYYARIVKEKAKLRAIIYATNKALAQAYEADDDAASIADAHVRELSAIGVATSSRIQTAGEVVHAYAASLDGDRSDVIPMGLVDVDDITGGFGRKKLSLIAARPSVGKTSLMLSVAYNIAAAGVPVGVITLEMAPTDLMGNMVSAVARIDAERIRRKTLGERDYGRLTAAMETISALPLKFVDEAHTLTQVQAWSRRLAEEHGAKVIFLDYIQMMGDPQARDRQQEVAHFSRGFKALARQHDVAFVALSQLSRASESRHDKRPQLSDLRESGALEQDADLVILLYRDEMHHKKPGENEGVAEAIVAKSRQGPTGVARLCFLKEQTLFTNLAPMGY